MALHCWVLDRTCIFSARMLLFTPSLRVSVAGEARYIYNSPVYADEFSVGDTLA